MVIIVGFGSNATIFFCLLEGMSRGSNDASPEDLRKNEDSFAQTSIHRLLQYDHGAADQ